MIVHTLKMCTGDAGPERSFFLSYYPTVLFSCADAENSVKDVRTSPLSVKWVRTSFLRKPIAICDFQGNGVQTPAPVLTYGSANDCVANVTHIIAHE